MWQNVWLYVCTARRAIGQYCMHVTGDKLHMWHVESIDSLCRYPFYVSCALTHFPWHVGQSFEKHTNRPQTNRNQSGMNLLRNTHSYTQGMVGTNHYLILHMKQYKIRSAHTVGPFKHEPSQAQTTVCTLSSYTSQPILHRKLVFGQSFYPLSHTHTHTDSFLRVRKASISQDAAGLQHHITSAHQTLRYFCGEQNCFHVESEFQASL